MFIIVFHHGVSEAQRESRQTRATTAISTFRGAVTRLISRVRNNDSPKALLCYRYPKLTIDGLDGNALPVEE